MVFAEIQVKRKARKAGRFSCLAIRNGNAQSRLRFQCVIT